MDAGTQADLRYLSGSRPIPFSEWPTAQPSNPIVNAQEEMVASIKVALRFCGQILPRTISGGGYMAPCRFDQFVLAHLGPRPGEPVVSVAVPSYTLDFTRPSSQKGSKRIKSGRSSTLAPLGHSVIDL